MNELLRQKNNKLVETLESVKDENIMLWQHMDEMKEAERQVIQTLADEIHESMIRDLKPVGDA